MTSERQSGFMKYSQASDFFTPPPLAEAFTPAASQKGFVSWGVSAKSARWQRWGSPHRRQKRRFYKEGRPSLFGDWGTGCASLVIVSADFQISSSGILFGSTPSGSWDHLGRRPGCVRFRPSNRCHRRGRDEGRVGRSSSVPANLKDAVRCMTPPADEIWHLVCTTEH